ncbi:HAD family hydrolase [Methylococcus sp. EFPC2]|uniref:HAD family hydrolase n=1 Tax=Methylococcus sp. EFPC2 TaxID=2812648 RepID=UPI0019682F21|nr:HAD-IA family hydrolase [Methylococcus sp. EFPC2]QSA95770.1 HAD-IA family hydrolase [Methylococcus sp. EFPC2]
MKQRFDLLVFDWDGTLFDSIDWIVLSLQQAARENGLPIPDPSAAKSVIGLSIAEAMYGLFPGVEASRVERLIEVYRRHYESRAMGADSLFAGVSGLLERLREAGYKLAVATGKGRDALQHALHITDTSHLFDAWRTAEETASKPRPDMLLQLMDELAVSAERTLMIGDSVHDLRMARNAGAESIGVACGANSRDELLALEPLLCLEHTVELGAMLV